MKKMKRTCSRRPFCFLIALIMLMAVQSVKAQGKLTGQVKDSAGLPVKGATISLKNKKTSTMTAADGSFSLAAAPGDVLLVSSIGYVTLEMKVGSTGNLTLALVSRATSMDDVVVVGYGTQRKKDLTGSISTVDIADAKKYSASDMSQLLQGR